MASTVRSEGSDDLAEITSPWIGIPPSPPLDASMTWGIAAPAGDDGKTTTRHRARPAASKRQSPCLMRPLLGARLFERVIAQVFGPPDYGLLPCPSRSASKPGRDVCSLRHPGCCRELPRQLGPDRVAANFPRSSPEVKHWGPTSAPA